MTTINLDDERRALLTLVQESEGKKKKSSWSTSLRGWSAHSTIPLCEWSGITCRGINVNGDGHDNVADDNNNNGAVVVVVTGVNLTQMGLSGTIPTELGLLTDLEELTLGNNMLQGSIPHEVANLKQLRMLDLTKCFLTGTLPRRFESPYLTRLLLADNAISGRFFRSEEDDDDDDDDENESTVGNNTFLHSLKEIRMENNLLTGTLHGPSISKSMPHIEILSLSDNDLSGLIPGELGSLSDLRYLYLDSNHFVGPLPGQLAQAAGSRASSSSSSSSILLELWVQDNALSGTVPASYARLDNLRDFFIDGNKLTGALPPELCSPRINADFFARAPAVPKNSTTKEQRNYCDSIACPTGSVALEGMYPCTECPGGEASRLKNRYLGQMGKCSNYTQRQILEVFHAATTKGGPWNGVDDWNDRTKPVCRMTGVVCDAQNHVVEISLKNRNLQGHIPDQLGSLSFLEVLDVSDNALVGYVPGDLRWTSLTRLDVSGNRLRGAIPPLLCKVEGLNGNGEDDVSSCNRVACPAGTSNAFGFRHGVDGEECRPCHDDSPYIAQKECSTIQQQQPAAVSWKVAVQTMAKGTSEKMGVSVVHGLAIAFGALIFLVAICWLGRKRHMSRKRRRERGTLQSAYSDSQEVWNDEGNELNSLMNHGQANFRRQDNPQVMSELENAVALQDDASYTFSLEDATDEYSLGPNDRDSSLYRTPAYRDSVENARNFDNVVHHRNTTLDENSVDFDDDDDGGDSNMSWSQRSAVDFVNEHRGITLNKRERLKRSVSENLPVGDLSRAARETASAVNVRVRRRWHAHIARPR